MAREDRGVEDEAAKSGGWRADGSRLVGGWLGWVGEADCTRCAVRLTACALRRRPTTLLFEKGREDGGTEGRRGDGWNGRARGEGEGGWEGKVEGVGGSGSSYTRSTSVSVSSTT